MNSCARPSVPLRPLHEPDSGLTLVEILVAVMLLGTVVVSTLGVLRISILGGTAQRDHANAHAWLQSASDVLYASTKVECSTGLPDSGKEAIRVAYQAVVDPVPNPETWTNSQIRIIDIQFWNSADSDNDGIIEFRFGTTCQDDENLSLQRILIQVRSPDGRIIEQVELIK